MSRRVRPLAVAVPCLTALAACGESAMPDRAPGTVAMATRLERLAATVDTRRYIYANAVEADSLLRVEPPTDFRPRLEHQVQVAEQLLYAGRPDDAVDGLQNVLRDLQSGAASGVGETIQPDFLIRVVDLLGVAYLRIADRENCLAEAQSAACRIPLEPGEAHRQPRGALAATRTYRALLTQQPDHLGARWMLNLAYMMLGQYPDSVPDAWVIPSTAFESEHDVGRFPEIAPALGLDVEGNVGGSIMDDFDGDGLLDIVASSWGLRDQLRFFRNEGDGTFADRTAAAGILGIVGGGQVEPADFDNDGFLDVLILRGGWLPDGHPNSLLRNNGDGTFADVTDEAGLAEPFPSQTAAWADFDGDGWIDLAIGNESSGSRRFPSQIFRNNGDGTFTDVGSAVGGAMVGFTKGLVAGDYDNDGRPDLFFAQHGQPNVLLRNEATDDPPGWRFTDVSRAAGILDPQDSFATWFFDYDNDGWLDLFVSGYRTNYGDVAAEYLGRSHRSELPRLYRNGGDGTFADVTRTAAVDRIMFTMGSNFGDLDNDGFLDFYVGTGDAFFQALLPNRMFRNDGGRRFQDVTTSGGFGHVFKGHGVAFGDLDNDGDQDIYAVQGGAYEGDLARNVLFRNPGHGHGWITLRLRGTRSNAGALGARVRVDLATPDGERSVHRMVGSGGSFGANSLQLEIGLGDATGIRRIAVWWPATGERAEYDAVDMNRVYDVREGESTLRVVTLPVLPLAPASSAR